ncbi:hypothetical protein [Deinococcus altitudinis]|uniref:hypothetical protein n=1 Tax=Deinococcus altitudinis TaxID=468914 RepID=UPI0038928336
MLTVAQVEQLIQSNEQQARIVFLLISQIRAEPAWEPGVEPDPVRLTGEDAFQRFEGSVDRMNTSVSRFRLHSAMMETYEEAENAQDVLREMDKVQTETATGLLEMKNSLLTLLNSLLLQRGEPAFELISPNAN